MVAFKADMSCPLKVSHRLDQSSAASNGHFESAKPSFHLADVYAVLLEPVQQARDLLRILVLRVVEVLKGLHHAPDEEDEHADQGQGANQDRNDVLSS